MNERTAELTGLSHYLQRVQEEEKAKIAREIHDELGGTLAAAKIDLQLVSDKLPGGDPQRARLTRIMSAIDDTIQVKRRIIEDLRPTLLDNLGIGAALKWQCSQFSKRSDMPCRVELQDESLRLSPAYSIAFYRVVQESLTNITKYAKAKNVTVSLLRRRRPMDCCASPTTASASISRRGTTPPPTVSCPCASEHAPWAANSRPGAAGTRHGRGDSRAGREGTAVTDAIVGHGVP